jgi:hypothetical protein
MLALGSGDPADPAAFVGDGIERKVGDRFAARDGRTRAADPSGATTRTRSATENAIPRTGCASARAVGAVADHGPRR